MHTHTYANPTEKPRVGSGEKHGERNRGRKKSSLEFSKNLADLCYTCFMANVRCFWLEGKAFEYITGRN